MAIPHPLLKLRSIHSFSVVFFFFFFTLHKHSKTRTHLEKQAPKRCADAHGGAQALQTAVAVGPSPAPLVPAVVEGSGCTAPCAGGPGTSAPPAPSRHQGCIRIPVAATYTRTTEASSCPAATGSTRCVSAGELCPKQSRGAAGGSGLAGGRAPRTKTTLTQPSDQVREEERRVKATRLDCRKHVGRNASSSTVSTLVSSSFPERRCEHSPGLAPIKPIPTYAAAASDPRDGAVRCRHTPFPGNNDIKDEVGSHRARTEAEAVRHRRSAPGGETAGPPPDY